MASPFAKVSKSMEGQHLLDKSRISELNHLYSPLLGLSPAKWIWYPSERTLQNSVFLFRKAFHLGRKPASATGWILADSRYKLYVNGQYIQFGPAPFDPRQPEADPVDITRYLKSGKNVIGAEVLYYGIGEGTWPIGKPGFIVNIESDNSEAILTDSSWQVRVADSWKPGQYKRWYLRAFQEEFDARKYPYGWNLNEFETDHHWLPAMELDLPADKPPISSPYDEYQQEIRANPDDCNIRERSITLMEEFDVNDVKLADRFGVEWKGDPARYFEFVTPGIYEPSSLDDFSDHENGSYSFNINPPKAAVLTFEFEEQIVGFPHFSIEAPEGTIVEMMIQEGHEPDNFLMNNRLHSWSRFICKEDLNEFTSFDYESLRFIQFHIHGKPGRITLSNLGVKRRMSGWESLPSVATSDEDVNRVLSATINTLYNSAQDLMVDCMGRERQQYSGDVGHQIHSLFSAFGDKQLPFRFVNTFSQGITLDGFFMDSWPAYDRLARIPQRQMGLTMWGPIIDHGVGFVFDCYYSYLYSDAGEMLHETYPRLLRFFDYLISLMNEDGMLPVEDLGLTWVWMDSDCYQQQRHKECAFNLYNAAMMKDALAPIAEALGDSRNAKIIADAGKAIHEKTVQKYWDSSREIFVDNLPWVSEEGQVRLSDRTLSMAIIHKLNPNGANKKTIEALVAPPEYMGLSFPANAIWRLWALGLSGEADTIIDEIKTRWFNMASVQLNNSLQEHWSVQPDTRGQWSHCAIGPLFAAYNHLAGISPLRPGMDLVQIKPNLGKLEKLALDYHSPYGVINFSCEGKPGNRLLTIELPKNCEAILMLDEREEAGLQKSEQYSTDTHAAYKLESGARHTLRLHYS